MNPKIGLIGGGNMGTAILEGIAKDNIIYLCEADKKKARFLKRRYKVIIEDINGVIKQSDIIIIAVKPQDFETVLSGIKNNITHDKLLISIAAGVTTKFIEKKLGKQARVMRTMPNLPAHVGSAMTAVCRGKSAKQADILSTLNIFNCIGKTVIVDEKLIDSITAVSGSGPAYVFLITEYFISAATRLGIKPDLARKLIVQTMKGSLKMIESTKQEVSVLRKKVTSKGGTTEAALNVFLKRNINKAFDEALKAAKHRAAQLSK